MQDAIIYLGPSLPHNEAEEILDADYRLPVRRGDLIHAIKAGPKVIGIIDGFFFQNCAVGHREILGALKAGIRVVGASSMGALRASELNQFGMEGVGEVYRLYRDGIIESDDEVALVCEPETGVALSEALVNIRITCMKACKDGIITEDEYGIIMKTAADTYYPDRSWPVLMSDVAKILPKNRIHEIQNWLYDHKIDQKQLDAREALRYISDIL